MRNSLEFSNRALEIAPEQVHFKFNVAFVQIQVAQMVYTLPESQRTFQDVQSASDGLDEAIESLTMIAQSKNPPYPKHDIEQRANMGRNTMRRQLERALQGQKEYEDKNAAKLQQARDIREAEIRTRDQAKREAEEAALEEKRKIAEERHAMLEVSRKLAETRAEEERRKEEAEYTEDEETGERVKKKKKKASGGGKSKKRGEDTDTDGEVTGGETGTKARGRSTTENSALGTSDEERVPKRRRKLERKGAAKDRNKFKSSEIVVESESEEEGKAPPENSNGTGEAAGSEADNPDTSMHDAADDDEDETAAMRPRKHISRRVDDDEEDEEEDEAVAPPTPAAEEGGSEQQVKGSDMTLIGDGDTAMVDASVAAAGDADAAEY